MSTTIRSTSRSRSPETGVPPFFRNRASVPSHVLVKEMGGTAVLLNLESADYLGLDAVGARMWTVATNSPTLEDAFETLRGESDVDGERLRHDLAALVDRLQRRGLIEVTSQ